MYLHSETFTHSHPTPTCIPLHDLLYAQTLTHAQTIHPPTHTPLPPTHIILPSTSLSPLSPLYSVRNVPVLKICASLRDVPCKGKEGWYITSTGVFHLMVKSVCVCEKM